MHAFGLTIPTAALDQCAMVSNLKPVLAHDQSFFVTHRLKTLTCK